MVETTEVGPVPDGIDALFRTCDFDFVAFMMTPSGNCPRLEAERGMPRPDIRIVEMLPYYHRKARDRNKATRYVMHLAGRNGENVFKVLEEYVLAYCNHECRVEPTEFTDERRRISKMMLDTKNMNIQRDRGPRYERR